MKPASFSDRAWIAPLLAVSLDQNKSVNYIARQDSKRVESIHALMEYAFDCCMDFGQVWVADDRRACALILFPDKQRTTWSSLRRDWKLAWHVVGLSRLGAIMRREKMIKEHHPGAPFAYLFFFGVDKTAQGKGVGSALLRDVLLECDRLRRPVYLETSMEINLPFYQRQGFEVFAELELSYRLYLLRRTVNGAGSVPPRS